MTTNLISKYCNIIGIARVEINPCYSSFIGNIQHEYIDPVNASLEICRRGIYKYEKGKFYPEISEKDVITMSNLIEDQTRDNRYQNTECLKDIIQPTTWVEWFNLFQKTKFRYRRSRDLS